MIEIGLDVNPKSTEHVTPQYNASSGHIIRSVRKFSRTERGSMPSRVLECIVARSVDFGLRIVRDNTI